MADLPTWDVVLRVVVAALLAGLVGVEREYSAQQAGFRTHTLVGLGAAVFSVAGLEVTDASPTRVAAQVVSGIGFLGAGAILREGINIRGLTTAASLWVAASLGLAVGLGAWVAATTGTAVSVLTLVALRRLERGYFPRRRGQRVSLDVDRSVHLARTVEAAIGTLGDAEVTGVITGPDAGLQRVTLKARLPEGLALTELAERLRTLDGVRGVELLP